MTDPPHHHEPPAEEPPRSQSTPAEAGDAPARIVSLPLLETHSNAVRPSTRSRWRACVLIAVHLVFIAHLTHWLITGSTVSPVEPSESMQTLELGLVNAGFIFFSLAILSTLIFGRFFCGWGCHIVALQDLCSWLLSKLNIRPKPFRSRLLMLIPLGLALYMFVWPTFKRLALMPWIHSVPDHSTLAPLAGFLSTIIRPPAHWPADGAAMHLMVDDFWQTFPGPLVAIPFLLICGFASVYFLGAKGFCTYGCPYGGFFAPIEQLSPGRIVVDQSRCDGHAHCTAACTSNVRVHEEIARFGMVVSPGCMKCMDCISVCPTNALSFKFTRPAIFKGKPAEPKHPNAKRASKRSLYDTTLIQDLALLSVFLLTLIAARGLYDLVPLLMAVGIAAITTFLAWKAWQTLRAPNARFRSWQFKKQGKLTRTGAAYLALCCVLVVAIVHAGIINLSSLLGSQPHDRLPFNPALLYTANPPAITAEIRERAARALPRLKRARPFWAGGFGLAASPSSDLKLATMQTITGDRDGAIASLERVLKRQPKNPAVYLRLGNLLIDADRTEDAITLYTAALERVPWSVTIQQDLAGLLMASGRFSEAQTILSDALAHIPHQRKHAASRAAALELLGHLAVRQNNPEQAMAHYLASTEADPKRAQSFESLAGAQLNIRRDPKAAIASLERAIALDPANPNRWMRLLQLTGSVEGPAAGMAAGERAIAALTQARDARPRDPDRWLNLARMQATLSQLDAAIATIDAGRNASPAVPFATHTLIEFAHQLRRPDLAARWAAEPSANPPATR